jgi:molybdate transport system substrate-binding protein
LSSRKTAWLSTLLVTAHFASGCSCGAQDDRRELTVFAAASLTDAFEELAQRFEAAHADVNVALSFAGSQVLRLQIEHGAHADVFASANPHHMDALLRADLVDGSRGFAENELVVIVPPDNPAGIESLADLPRARRLVIGTPSVPVGSYTRQMLKRATDRLGEAFEHQVLARVVSQENNVRLVRTKVELGEADAAIVYRTDAVSSPRVRAIEIPAHANVRASYLIAVVRESPQSELARSWIEYVCSDPGRRVLESHGFSGAP